jgi:hypothetical protein
MWRSAPRELSNAGLSTFYQRKIFFGGRGAFFTKGIKIKTKCFILKDIEANFFF